MKPVKNQAGEPRKVPDDIAHAQQTDYNEDDFEDALSRVSRRLDDPSEPDRGSPKTAA